MEKINFKELLGSVGIHCEDVTDVRGICEDHREVRKDWLFLARKGTRFNGAYYIKMVLAQGGVVLCEEKAWQEVSKQFSTHAAIYFCDDVNTLQQKLLNKLYGNIMDEITLVGVSGTNGKSSVSHFIDRLWSALGISSMWIGTDGYRINGQLYESEHTTPSACRLYTLFQMAIDCGVTHIVMEVSSQAILHKRCEGLRFDSILLNPITSDHLDEHITKVQYRYTKFALRKLLKKEGYFLLQNDSLENREFYQFAMPHLICVGSKDAHFFIHDMKLSMKGSQFYVNDTLFQTPLLGKFQVMNLAMVIAYGRSVGIKMKTLQEVIQTLSAIEGRMQVIYQQECMVIVDYAHTSSALASLLQVVNEIKDKDQRVVTLFGCGGERDYFKRKEMGEVACMYSDEVIITSDNPRKEAAHEIIKQIIDFPAFHGNVIENRQFAMKHVLTNAKKRDIILICGRGSEMQQIVRTEKLPYQDKETVERILEGGFPCLFNTHYHSESV